MTAKDVSVGLTYITKVGDNEVSVTLTRECEWGGWYGREVESGHPLRIATAGRLLKRVDGEKARSEARMTDNVIHTQTMEATMATATPAAKAAKDARAARRSRPTPAAKPAAAPAAKPAAKKTAARKAASKPAVAPEAITVTQDQLADLIAKAVAEIQGANEATPEATPAAKPARRMTTPAKSAKTVKLSKPVAKRNSWQFKYVGTSKTPLVTAAYISNDAIEAFEGDTESMDLTLMPFDGNQPKNSIRFTDESESLRGGLYLMRNALVDSGITESTPITVKLSVVNEDTIQLAISLA